MMPLSKSDIKKINALKIKKYRGIERQFIVEGQKNIHEFINAGYVPELLAVTTLFENVFSNVCDDHKLKLTDEDTMSKISNLTQAPGCLAVFSMAEYSEIIPKDAWVLATDNIQDPGNLGTLIRIADWFGIQHIVCSEDTVDAYNPKVVQATMGSLAHIEVHYKPLKEWLGEENDRKVYAGLLDGTDIRNVSFAEKGVLLIGNESKGVSEELLPYVSQAVFIPKLGEAESLNAGVAAGIIASFALLR